MALRKPLKKRAGSGCGSLIQWYRLADPGPYQSVSGSGIKLSKTTGDVALFSIRFPNFRNTYFMLSEMILFLLSLTQIFFFNISKIK